MPRRYLHTGHSSHERYGRYEGEKTHPHAHARSHYPAWDLTSIIGRRLKPNSSCDDAGKRSVRLLIRHDVGLKKTVYPTIENQSCFPDMSAFEDGCRVVELECLSMKRSFCRHFEKPFRQQAHFNDGLSLDCGSA